MNIEQFDDDTTETNGDEKVNKLNEYDTSESHRSKNDKKSKKFERKICLSLNSLLRPVVSATLPFYLFYAYYLQEKSLDTTIEHLLKRKTILRRSKAWAA